MWSAIVTRLVYIYAQLLFCPCEFSRQEYWSGLLFPTTGDLLDPGIEPGFLQLAGRFFLPLCHLGSPLLASLDVLHLGL